MQKQQKNKISRHICADVLIYCYIEKNHHLTKRDRMVYYIINGKKNTRKE